MHKLMTEFIDDMSKNGYKPYDESQIKSDDKLGSFRTTNDKKNQKRGFFRLKIDDDFAFGYYGDYRIEGRIAWHSKSDKKYSRAEMAELKKRQKKSQLESKENDIRLRNDAAINVLNEMLFIERAPDDHPYLMKKGIKAHGILLLGNDLYIPMQDVDGKVWNRQTVSPDGTKLFSAGARVTGNFYKIVGNDVVYLCEGFATGATIHECTGATVIVAFNSGNLSSVAPLFPNAIIAADNDHETTIHGKKHNTGLIKAESIGHPYCYPRFKDGSGLSDFNDLYAAEGREATMESLHIICEDAGGVNISTPDLLSASPPALSSDEWREGLLYNKDGVIISSSTVNASLIMEYDPKIAGVFVYDSFSKQILLRRCPPWMDSTAFGVRSIQDRDFIPLECYLEAEWGIRANKNKCADLIGTISTLPDNVINPASDYFNNIKWDGIPRLDGWFEKYVTDGKQSSEYLSMVGRKFMCGLASRAMKPGCKFDNMLIFEGRQYAGKSFLARIMATVNGAEYFLDDFKDIDNKDALMKMQGKLIVEMAEINTMRRSDVSDMKAFVTRCDDVFRPPYARTVLISPRQCVFIGTVNPEGEYLRDVTGNRRYWPVSCRGTLPLDELREVMPQLHAEAAHFVKLGEDIHVSINEYELAEKEQESRVIVDMWVDKIIELTTGLRSVSTKDLCKGLEIPTERQNALVFSRLNSCMAFLKWETCRLKVGSNRVRGYRQKDPMPNDLFEDKNEEEDVIW